MKNVYPQAELIHSDVLSFDSCVSMREAREHLKKHALMGNVSTWTLEFGQPEKVEQLAVKCWREVLRSFLRHADLERSHH